MTANTRPRFLKAQCLGNDGDDRRGREPKWCFVFHDVNLSMDLH
jgi:hypothetical protein